MSDKPRTPHYETIIAARAELHEAICGDAHYRAPLCTRADRLITTYTSALADGLRHQAEQTSRRLGAKEDLDFLDSVESHEANGERMAADWIETAHLGPGLPVRPDEEPT